MKSDARNQNTWSKPSVVALYERREGLQFAEEKALALLETEFRNKAILDLGVGTGRTTPALRALSDKYCALDYSPKMIEASRKRFPDVDFRVGDARDLSSFSDASIDLVMFAYNGIDYVRHNDRLTILREISRILAPTGAFCFSSSNRNAACFTPAFKTLELREYPTLNPARIAHRLMKYIFRNWNALHSKRQEEVTEEYAILNVPWVDYRLLQYHISPERQVKQLYDAKFASVTVLNGEGTVPEQLWSTTRDSVYYIARK